MGILIIFILAIVVSVMWVGGIDKMKKEYPDYKGEDYLNWNEIDKK